MNLDDKKMVGFVKWLTSTKFQVTAMLFAMAVFLVMAYHLDPAVALHDARDVALGYLTTQVAQPIVEFITAKLGKVKEQVK